MGDPLEKVAGGWILKYSAPRLTQQQFQRKGDKGGRPPMDNMLMFKIMLLSKSGIILLMI